MSNIKEAPKPPNSDITDYEWEVTPRSVKAIIEQLQQLTRQKQHRLEDFQRENKWLKEQLDLVIDRPNRPQTSPLPEVLLWSAIGLILTIAGTFVPASIVAAPWSWNNGLGVRALGVSFQIGAVLFTACVGGKNAALLSQIAYVALGISGLPLFDRGGGLNYLQQPHFGYLLGFIVGGWLCGWLAFQTLVKFSTLLASCLVGTIAIHGIGIIYLTLASFTGLVKVDSLAQSIVIYSINPFLGQLAVLCAVSLVAFITRKIMFA